MNKIISQETFFTLQNLRQVADKLQESLDLITHEAQTITGEVDDGGYTFDFIMNDFLSIEELLEKLEIEVGP